MNKKFYRLIVKPVLILLLASLLLMISFWSDSFITNRLTLQKNELKTIQEIYQTLREWPTFEAKIDNIRNQYTQEGLFWKDTEKAWETTVKSLALKHNIHHLNHTVQKKGVTSTHTFEMNAPHDYDILGFFHEFLMLKMGYTQVQTFIIHLPHTQKNTTTGILTFNRMIWDD